MVLLVDDDALFLESAERALTKAGLRIVPAANGVLALAAIRSVREIKIVLLDLDLPDISGMFLIGAMREIRPDLKIIAMTGVLPEHVLEVAKYLGAETTLQKPITREWESTIHNSMARASGVGPSQ